MDDVPSLNPYQAPDMPAEIPLGRPPAREQLVIPAIILLVCEAPWAMYWLFVACYGFAVTLGEPASRWQEVIGPLAMMLLINAVSAGIIWGAIDMLRLNSYRSARLAAFLAMCPFCGPCMFVGIPLGLWAWVILMRPEVKSAFKKA